MTAIGFVGLGMMGSAMCRRLTETGATVLVHDLDRARVDAATEHGAVAAGSTTAITENTDIVSICVPAAVHVEAVLDQMIAAATERIEAKVAEGRIDADRAAEILGRLEDRFTALLNRVPGERAPA